MSLRKMFLLSMVAALCLCRPAFSQQNGLSGSMGLSGGIEVGGGATAQVDSAGKWGGGRFRLLVRVTDPEGKVLASIPIERDPSWGCGTYCWNFRYFYSKSANTLYILRGVKKHEHFISAVNLTTNREDKQIELRAGSVEGVLMSNDGRRLYCYTAGKERFIPATGESEGDTRLKSLTPPYEPAISVIDTASNEVIATYNWLDNFRADVVSKTDDWSFGSQLLAATDGGVLVVRSEALGNKPFSGKFIVFSGSSSHPVFMIDTGGPVVASMMSKDQKLLYAAYEGDKNTEGSLVVVDLVKGTSVTHALTDHPKKLFRLGTMQEPWVLGDKEMQALSESYELTEKRIQLNKPAKSGTSSETGESAFLNSYPGEALSLADDHAAILINKYRNGGSRHKVALIDLKKLQIVAIIPTMSAGEKANILTGRILTSVIMSAATGGYVVFTPDLTFNDESLAARPDGRFLFVLDRESHEVTVVDVPTATVVKYISVNNSVTKLQVSSDGKHLICFGKQTQQINLETNNLEN
jgi:DNA-binding beta-propeller fold protein YncE